MTSAAADHRVGVAVTMQNAAVANGNGTFIDVKGYPTTVLQVVSSPAMSGGTTVNFEATADNVTWVAVLAHPLGGTTIASTTTADGTFRLSTIGLLAVRARISAYSAGTVTILGYVGDKTPALTTIQAVQAGVWTVQPGNTANTTAWKVDGSAVTQPVSVAALATGGYTYLHIPAGIATTIVKGSAGTLHSIVLNSAATATNTTTIYDNASVAGTIIGVPAVTTATVPTTLIYDIAFLLGLVIITAVANGGSMTICFK